MASLSVTQTVNSHAFSLPLLFLTIFCPSFVAPYEFQVGGIEGWTRPTPNDTRESYNEWATKNRFHVGDTLHFKYHKDSVLVVNYTSYENCTTSDPVFQFEDGNTTFRFDRHGFFYFISGQPGHCRGGQKLVIRVMVQSVVEGLVAAPSPMESGGGGGGDDGGWDPFNWGTPSLNSTVKLSLASSFMTALGGALVILYLFM